MPMSPETKARYDALAKNPEYLHYMTVLFPSWMAHTPGGKEYQLESYPDLQSRVIRWWNTGMRLLQKADELNIRWYGAPQAAFSGIGPKDSTVISMSMASNLRKLRNNWKKEMRIQGLVYNDEMWRVSDARSGRWDNEWKEFHEKAKEVLSDKSNG